MSKLKIKCRKSDLTVEVAYVFPNTVMDAVERYGEDVVLNRFVRQISQELRATVIRQVETVHAAGGDDKAVKAAAKKAAATFKPGVTTGTSRAVKVIDKALENLSEEERELVLKALGTTSAPNSVDMGTDALASE